MSDQSADKLRAFLQQRKQQKQLQSEQEHSEELHQNEVDVEGLAENSSASITPLPSES